MIRSAIAPVAGFASTLAFPLFLIGMFFRSGMSLFFMDLGILFFSGAVVFQLVTLPVEFNASKRALAQLTETGAIAPQEVAGAKQVLDAAALTYVAAAAMAALQLLRLVLLRNSRRLASHPGAEDGGREPRLPPAVSCAVPPRPCRRAARTRASPAPPCP